MTKHKKKIIFILLIIISIILGILIYSLDQNIYEASLFSVIEINN